jgi:hypothetical protein
LFESEKALVDEFVRRLLTPCSPWGELKVAREFDYRSGRTDVVALSDEGCVVAFEAKLTRWREALHQAYRNLCFANLSYVLLPKPTALAAVKYLREFDRRGVGLCYVDGDDLVVLHEAANAEPLQPWLYLQAVDTTLNSGHEHSPVT